MYVIKHYVTTDDQDVYAQWLRKLKDTTAKIAIVRRGNRIEQGNFGDHKFCRDGVWELRVDVGAVLGVLRHRRPAGGVAAVRWRQTDAGCRYCACLRVLARLAKENVMKDKPHDEAMAELYREEPD